MKSFWVSHLIDNCRICMLELRDILEVLLGKPPPQIGIVDMPKLGFHGLLMSFNFMTKQGIKPLLALPLLSELSGIPLPVL